MVQVVKTNSNLLEPGSDVSKYSQAEIDNRIYGSKLVLVVEQMQILTTWLVKTCLLIMYNRMTLALPQHWVVQGTAIYVGVAFVGDLLRYQPSDYRLTNPKVVMEVLYFGVWCRPFNQVSTHRWNAREDILTCVW
jgi:hypothetical protein